MEITYLIIYDITNDKIRNRLAERLECYGLERIHYSAFIGKLKRYRLNSLIEDIKNILQQEKVQLGEKRNVQIYPLFKINLRSRIVIDASKGKVRVNVEDKKEKHKARIF